MKLHDFQQAFMAAVYREHNNIEPHLLANDKLTGAERLAIYQGSVAGGLIDALGDVYPACRRLLGDEFFDAMADRYVLEIPSRSANIGDYGRELAEFIEEFPPLADFDYIADVARLEWQLHEIFHEADDQPLLLDVLAQWDTARQLATVFRLPRAARLLQSEYPVDQLWQVNRDDFDGDDEISLDDGPVFLLVWRRGFDTRIEPLSEAEWLFLNTLQQGLSFEALFTTLSESQPQLDVSTLFGQALQRGWIADNQAATASD